MRKLALFLSFLFVISCSKDPIIYTLTTSANPADGGTVSPSTQQYDEGKTATITATASSEYVFQSWSGATGSTNSTSVVMNSDKSVTANFVKKKYAITTTVEGEGTVTEKVIKAGAATDYNSGTIVELTATPSDEWQFIEWKGDLTGTENPTQITIDKAKSVTAVFVKKQYPLTIEIEGEGTVAEKVIKAGVATDYNSGTIVELTATPSDEWEFKEWTGDITSTENPAEITIDASKTVKAVFVKKQYPLTVEVEGEGTVAEKVIKAGAATDYNSGTVVELTATGKTGWEFKEWTGDLESTENPAEITIDASKTVKAVFVKKQFAVNITIEGEGGGTVAEEVVDGLKVDSKYEYGTKLKLTAEPTGDWEFVGWTGDITSTENPVQITIDEAKTITVNFELLDTDGDGVTDGVDTCPDTPSGVKVDTNGCTLSPIYLDDNGVTIKARDFAVVGESYVLDGVTYTIADWDYLWSIRDNNDWERMSRAVTTKLSSFPYNFWYKKSPTKNTLKSWDVSNFTTMKDAFNVLRSSDLDLSYWDVSNVTNMEGMFKDSDYFNGDISTWDVSNVTDMSAMFLECFEFNGDISSWDVSNVNDMAYMFRRARSFNQDISSWKISNTQIVQMFESATSFNQDISNWDVSKITNMKGMFRYATSFNQDISNWDVSNVNNMSEMFKQTTSFDQDISNWNVVNVTNCLYFSDSQTWTTIPNFTNCTP